MAGPKGLEGDAGAEASLLLGKCSPVEQTLLVQRYVQGMELKEIAAGLGLSEITVRVRIHRCRRGLQARIRRTARRPGPGGPRVFPPGNETGAAGSSTERQW